MRRILGSPWIGYLAALVAVAAVTGAIELLMGRLEVENSSLLYLVAVLATATAYGSGPAILAATASVLTFEWFFVEPYHNIVFTSARQYTQFLLFLLTAIITGQLAASLRRRAWESQQRERDAVLLHDLLRVMSEESDLDRALRAVAERLRQELNLSSVAIQLSAGTLPGVCIEVGDDVSAPIARGTPGRLYSVPIEARDRRVGMLHLVRSSEDRGGGAPEERLLSAVVTQLGLAVERAALRREATEGEILRRTDELKTALLSAVSHDLRTPLASIIASAGSLLETDVDWSDQERQEFAEAIEQEALRLNRLVGNLLDLSRIQAGSLHPQKGWYDLGALVDDVLGRLQNVTSQHRVATDLPEDLPPVFLDYVEIDQVLSNLVENAVKYTPAGTEVAISARMVGDQVEVVVADRGAGIPPEALPRVFEQFFRGEPDGSRPRGTGLGLAVARGLVEAHGGLLWAENRPEGGARFAFRLPQAELSRRELTRVQEVE